MDSLYPLQSIANAGQYMNENKYRVYRAGEWPKPKKHYYPNSFEKRQQARQFCRSRAAGQELTIVHPDGIEEKYLTANVRGIRQ